ncbi:unnamed protein product [Fusarium equiseti]|uniref:Pentatricopeptide repeat protein n=1 Tax=Fusarium equiseti TaxID=61235 RepID=A0A8J2IUM4_FUSEQ|nr:unnamed protein product [Fusarium equiseti]
MPAALMLRACSRLESSVKAQTWTRRAATLALRQNTTRNRSILNRPYHTESRSTYPEEGTQILSQLRLRKTAANLPDTSTAEDTQGSRTSSGSQWRSNQDQRSFRENKDKRISKTRSKGPSKTSPDAHFYQQRQTRDPESIRKAAEYRQKAKQREKKRREKYDQWGYLRHQYSGDELATVKKQFNSWHANLDAITAQTKSNSFSWRDDGKFLFELENVSEMEKTWNRLDVEVRKEQWPGVMLSTLYARPEKAIQVLEATLDPLPPGYAMAGVAEFCISTLNLNDTKVMRDRVTKADEVLELFAKMIEDVPSGHVPLRQSTLGLVATKLPVEQTAEVYQILQRSEIKLHRNTLLKFACKLGRSHTHKEQAFQILRSIADESHDLNSPSIASVITTLLHTQPRPHHTWSESEDSFSPQRAMEYFLERGFSPNLVSFTALIESLCLQGDIDEAVRLPLLLAENGAKLDRRCYTTVFRGAKNSLKASNIQRALDVARAAKVPHVDVLNNTLHSIFYFAEMESRDKRYPAPYVVPMFGPMLRVYAKRFDLEPLQWLLPDTLPLLLSQDNMDGTEKFRWGPQRHWNFRSTIVPVVNEFFDSNDGPLRKPNTQTLAIMMRGYIKTLHRPYDLMSFYTWFKSRLEERGTELNLAQQLVKEQGSIIHDTLILVMLERKVLLRPALQVFGDMLRDSLIAKPPEEGKQGILGENFPVHPAPNLFTFSILLHGLLMRREVMLAEQVRQALRENNLEPNAITWNTLVKGYAAMQDLSRTVDALQDLEAAGYKPDMHTFKAFAKLKDQTRALEMMEKIIDENRKRLEEHQLQ